MSRINSRKGGLLKTIIKEKREKTGLTQVQVANKAKITERHYQRIEQGLQDPKLSTARLIAQALNCEVAEIFPPKL